MPTDDLTDILTLILEESMHVGDMHAGSISLYDKDTNTLLLVVGSGFSSDVNDAQTDFKRNPVLAAEGVESLIAVPLTLNSTIVGILYVDDFKPHACGDDQLRHMLSMLAEQAAQYIQKARLIRVCIKAKMN